MCGPLFDAFLVPRVQGGLGVAVHVCALDNEQEPLAGLEAGARGQHLDVEPDDLATRDRQRALVSQHGK
jgi:hypothetical protein